MKFLKYIVAVIFLVSFGKTSSATVISSYGCRTGDVVYANKMGTTNWYGADYDVYDRNGTKYSVNYNPGEQCDQVEVESISNQGSACWVNSYVNPNNNNTGVGGYGTFVHYTVNTCTPMNLPLDDYTWAILLVVGGLGAFYISKKGLLLN